LSEGGSLALAPAAWHDDGFWDRVFDGEPEALASFESAKESLLAEEATNS
jgi:hypothetical protein